MKSLTGIRVLVVEDDLLVAQIAVDMLEDLGVNTLGPAATVQQALSLLQTQSLDAVLLDVDLRGQPSHAVAQALDEKQIPYVFVTGYGAASFDKKDTPVLGKPYTQDNLADALTSLLSSY